MSRTFALAILLATIALVGCRKTLTFVPDPQPAYGPFSADYVEHPDEGVLIVKLWTNGYILPTADIVLADGTLVRPVTMHHWTGKTVAIAPVATEEVATITRLGDKEADKRKGGEKALYVTFRQSEIGPRPWRLRLSVPGEDPVYITLRQYETTTDN